MCLFKYDNYIKYIFQIKYKETYKKDKEKAVGINMSDSKTLHSLQVAKMSSDVSRDSFLNQKLISCLIQAEHF